MIIVRIVMESGEGGIYKGILGESLEIRREEGFGVLLRDWFLFCTFWKVIREF